MNRRQVDMICINVHFHDEHDISHDFWEYTPED